MNILDSDGIPLIDQTSNLDDKVLLEISCFLFEDLKQMLATLLLSKIAPYLPIEKFVHSPTLQKSERLFSNQAYLSYIYSPQKDTFFFEVVTLDDDG